MQTKTRPSNYRRTNLKYDVPHADDDRPHASDERSPHAESAGGPAASGDIGPGDGLPSVVPDHVGEIHDTVGSFLDGTVENLGETLSDLFASGEGKSG